MISRRPLATAAVAALVALSPVRAHAQAKLRAEARADRTSVAIGDIVNYSMTLVASEDVGTVQAAAGSTNGFDVLSSKNSSGQSVVVQNGVIEKSLTLTVTFRMRAKKLGPHQLGPAKFTVAGKVISAKPVTVQVVPAGGALPGGSPLHDPFDDLFFKDDEPEPPPPDVPPSDPLAKVTDPPTDPRERNLFIRVGVSDKKPVVGAQVTAKLFVYARRNPRISVKRPPVFTEFATIHLGQPDKQWHPITIAGEAWQFATIDAFAIFPLKKGSLVIGSAELESVLSDPFGMPGGGEQEHKTPEVTVEAVEPPAENRPADYAIGDVAANLEMMAKVVPLVVTDGHALVTLSMKGEGRLDPIRPLLPTHDGQTWTATGDDARTSIEGLEVRGVRKMTYDVRFDKAGNDTTLGSIVVHVWDPKKKSYAKVSAELPRVNVQGAAPPMASIGGPALAALPPPRTTIGSRGDGATIADRLWTWGLVSGLPLLVLAAQAVTAASRRARARAAENESDPTTIAGAALKEARKADEARDDAKANAARVRAIDRALEGATGIRARGMTRNELVRALAESTLSPELQSKTVSALAALETARFAGGARASQADIEDLVDALLAAIPPKTSAA